MKIKFYLSLSLKKLHSLQHIKLRIDRNISALSIIKRIICRILRF